MGISTVVKATGLAAATLAVAMLAGCSSDSGSTTASTAPASSAAATTSAAPSAGMVGPIVVEPGTTSVSAEVGRFLDFKVDGDPADWRIESDAPEIVEVTQGGKEGDAVMNPGGKALKAGTAKISLIPTTGGTTWEITVTVV